MAENHVRQDLIHDVDAIYRQELQFVIDNHDEYT
jgi:hypothetical protein